MPFMHFRNLTDEGEILKFLQHGTLVGLLPVPHPILIRKYQANSGTTMWFRTYMWGIIYLRYAVIYLQERLYVLAFYRLTCKKILGLKDCCV